LTHMQGVYNSSFTLSRNRFALFQSLTQWTALLLSTTLRSTHTPASLS